MERLTVILYGITIGGYAISAALYVVYLLWRDRGRYLPTIFTVAVWLLHTGTLVLRLTTTRNLPFTSLFESTLFLTWVLILHYLLIELLMDLPVAGAFVMPVNFVFLFGGSVLTRSSRAIDPEVSGVWVGLHVFITFLSYAIFALAFVLSVMYLIQERQLRKKDFSVLFQRLPSLETMDILALRLVTVGFPLLTLGIVAGALWADVVWGRFWGWEIKEVWSLLTWLVYGSYLFLRWRMGWQGRRAAWVAVVGFVMTLINYFLVNLYFTDLHKYVL